jgi:outer membrane receptor protein involved in Fe transport
MKHFLTLLFLCYAYALQAQNNQFTVTGTTVDEKRKAISNSTVALHKSSDSSQITVVISDDKGRFEIKAQPGNYFLKITFLSYEDKLVSNVNITNANVDLGTLALTTSTNTLKNVTVTGEKKMMELKLDKKVYNVSKDISNAGANASEILGNIPSVTVDVDGNVSLRGSENVRILIDGKPSALTGIKSTDALRNLQGSMIESIEIITNPSSRNDATGEAGIINIILKKNKQKGVNGTFTANTGYPANFGGSYSINYRDSKINLFSNYGINYRSGKGYGSSYQQFTSNDTSFTYQQNSDRKRSEVSHNFMVGMDYYIDDKSSITGSFLYEKENENNTTNVEYFDYNKTGELMQTVLRTDKEKANEHATEASLSYRKKIKTDGRELTADFKWTNSADLEKSDYWQGSPAGDTFFIQRSDNPARENTWLFQTDYIHPFRKNGKLETGLKSTIRTIGNDYSLEQLNNDSGWVTLPAFNNNMQYKERIHAGYIMVGSKVKKLSYQVGLRGEYSDIITELIKTKEVNARQYFNLFPSSSLSYELNDGNTLQLSYSYRISRPRYRDLLPFSNFTDSRIYFVGNPALNPEYTHSLEAGHLFEWGNGSLLSGIYYRYKTDVIQRISTIDSTTGITNITPVNLTTQNAYGLEFNLTFSVKNWWKFNSGFNFYQAVTDGAYKEESLYSNTISFTNRTSSRMTFFKKWDFQASLNYQAPRQTTQGRELSVYFVDLGLTRDLLKGNGTITLNVRDLLNTRKRRSIIDIEDYYSESSFQWRTRQVMLTLSYRLNQQKQNERDENRQENFEGNDNGN